VHVDELLRLPFPLPDATPTPRRSWEIVKEVKEIVTSTAAKAAQPFSDREDLTRTASDSIETLIDEYFDILSVEKVLVDDTTRVIIPSVRPTRRRSVVPTIEPSQQKQRQEYTKRLCDTLNGWAKGGPFIVQGRAMASANLGIGIVILQKTLAGKGALEPPQFDDLLAALHRLRAVTSRKLNTFELIRGAKVFDRERLYLVKSIGQRFWTETAALNDADEIAGTILMHTPQEVA
jgi:hypothetical protein